VYVNPVLLPQFSNREDLLVTLSIYDDDLNVPVNLSGVTLAPANPNGLTGTAWTVTDGAISTTSSTQLTIPAYPIGSQLTALALTAGTGLGILPGDPITIADTATGLNSMAGYVTSYSSGTGALVCQIGISLQFEIRRGGPRNPGTGYEAWYDFGTPTMAGPLIAAALGTGITMIGTGFIQILIPEATFKTLSSGTYTAALTMTDSVNTRQLFIAKLPVLSGGVTN
jgi:hypothetical protein